MTARRLVLSFAELEVLWRSAPPDAPRPPGFAPVAAGDVEPALTAAAVTLAERGLLGPDGAHPALAADLAVLAAPEVAVSLTASRPGLDAVAVLALAGRRGAGLLRTDDAHVQLSAFLPSSLAVELARVVPAPVGPSPLPEPVELPLPALLDDGAGGPAASLHRRVAGALHATVAGRVTAPPVEWLWLHDGTGGGWVGLEPRGGPRARVVPVVPADLGAWLAPAVADVLAERAA